MVETCCGGLSCWQCPPAGWCRSQVCSQQLTAEVGCKRDRSRVGYFFETIYCFKGVGGTASSLAPHSTCFEHFKWEPVLPEKTQCNAMPGRPTRNNKVHAEPPGGRERGLLSSPTAAAGRRLSGLEGAGIAYMLRNRDPQKNLASPKPLSAAQVCCQLASSRSTRTAAGRSSKFAASHADQARNKPLRRG